MIERERKFLVYPHDINLVYALSDPNVLKKRLYAGYFQQNPAIRATCAYNDRTGEPMLGKICVKGPGTGERAEYEYNVPFQDALDMIELAPTKLMKYRYFLDGWEIDEFPTIPFPEFGTQLWMAEWEEAEGKARCPDEHPTWILYEVTGDKFFNNSHLAFKYGDKRSLKQKLLDLLR